MTVVFRSIVVWLMLLALPVQGFASATMMPCADGMHGAASAATAAPPQHDHAAMLAAAAGAHDGVAAASPYGDHAAAATAGITPMQNHHDHAVGGHGSLKCGGAACCAGVALAPCMPSLLPALPGASAPISMYAGFLPAVDPEHPERPPQGQHA